MLVVNFLFVATCIWAIAFINYRYLQPALKNRKRFELYKLRDELSLLAMSESLDEKSEEYLTLIKIINAAIKASRSFQVTDYLRFLFSFHKNKELQHKIRAVLEKIDKTDNEEYCRIASSTFSVMNEILQTDTRVLRHLFFPILILLARFLSLFNWNGPKQKVEHRKHMVEQIDDDLDEYSAEFGKLCTA